VGKVDFGIADEDVFTPAITLWAMVSQFLFAKTGRSCKAAAGRVVSLLAKTDNRVVAQKPRSFVSYVLRLNRETFLLAIRITAIIG
jgi:hypothetical protein